MSQSQKSKASSANSTSLSLEDAVRKGDAVLKSDLQKIIDAEIAKEMDKRKESLKTELQQDIAREEEERLRKQRYKQLGNYKLQSGLTDDEFCDKLIQWGVTARYAFLLRDEHKAMTREQVWAWIRKNEKNLKN